MCVCACVCIIQLSSNFKKLNEILESVNVEGIFKKLKNYRVKKKRFT